MDDPIRALRRYGVVPCQNSEIFYVRAHSPEQALEKLTEYVRDVRGYSEEEVRRFTAESRIRKIS